MSNNLGGDLKPRGGGIMYSQILLLSIAFPKDYDLLHEQVRSQQALFISINFMQGDSWAKTCNVINCITDGNVSWGTQFLWYFIIYASLSWKEIHNEPPFACLMSLYNHCQSTDVDTRNCR